MKKLMRILSAVIVLALIVGLFPMAAFADTREFKVVNIGDSTSNGFGLEDYGYYARFDYITSPDNIDFVHRPYALGFLDCGSDLAYPSRLADYIAEQHPEYDAKFTNLGISGIRGSEIRSIIDSSFEGDSYTQQYRENVLDHICIAFGISDLHELFVDEIRSADVITLDMLSNSYVRYLTDRVSAVLSGDSSAYADDTLALVYGSISPEIKAVVDPLSASLRSTLSDVFSGNTLTGIVDAFNYSVTESLVSFSETVKLIFELNPDVRLLVGGEYNPIYGYTFTYNGIDIDLADLLGSTSAALNSYITAVDSNRFKYSYIDLIENPQTAKDYMATFDSALDLPEWLTRQMVDYVFGFDHYYAGILCKEVRAEATELGYDMSDYSSIYPQDIVGFINNVRTLGDDADPLERLFAEKFIELLDYFLAGARVKDVDIACLLQAFSNYVDVGTVINMRDTPIDELTDLQRAQLFMFAFGTLLDGAGPHFSASGADAKYQSALKAYNTPLPAVFSAPKTVTRITTNAAKTFGSLAKSLIKGLFK